MTYTHVTPTEIAGPCVSCETEVHRQVPPLGAPFASVARNAPLMCDQCVQAADAEQVEQQQADQREIVANLITKRILASDLPASHRVLTIDELKQPDIVKEHARTWARNGGGLLLTGANGVGKTTVAGAAALEVLQRERLLWTSAPLLFARLGSGFDSKAREWALEVLAGDLPLVLDDLDKARPTEYGAEQVFLAIDQRVEHELPLLITTNLTPAQIAGRWPDPYGTAIASRIVGYCKIVRLEGDDRRLHGGDR